MAEITRVDTIDTPIWVPRILIMYSEEKMKGRKTVTVVRVAATTLRHTSVVPWITALSGVYFLPASL